MTKQEKLQEDVAEILTFFHIDIEWRDLAEDSKKPYRNNALILLSYLHSQGMVIKVTDQNYLVYILKNECEIVAVEPIITEVKDD